MSFSIPPSILRSIESTLGTTSEIVVARAPGRINLIGEHTDYNNGLVLPGAIDKYMYFACKPNGTNIINATALDLDQEASVDLAQLEKSTHLWMNFLIGILLEFQKKEVDLIGFDCTFSSQVPLGAGMSSSSALECAILIGLKEVFGAQHLDNWSLINMSRSSNHNFLGIKGGIMDQFASLFGRKNHVMFLDCATLNHTYVRLPESEYSWLLINSCVKHNNLTSGYNDRVNECKQAVKDINAQLSEVVHLSDITNTEQLDRIAFSSEDVKKRAYFVVEENARVNSLVSALEKGNFELCGSLLYASHKGLSSQYEVSCDELDFLVDFFREEPSVLGSRMMGGGFGGCTINLVRSGAIGKLKGKVLKL